MEHKAIGEIIRERRKSRKVTQDDLAEIAGISIRTLRDIENGMGNPALETLVKICHVLGLEIKVEVIR